MFRGNHGLLRLAALWLLPLCISSARAQGDSVALSPPPVATGSVDRVSAERMNKGLLTRSRDALSGQAAGVNVSSSGENRMAMLNSVRVRGTTSLTGGNDPLVIIDGVSSDLATLSTIYPADIESFNILKNAAETAQYGSRGASGVIEVVTKKGRAEQFHISYDGNDIALKQRKVMSHRIGYRSTKLNKRNHGNKKYYKRTFKYFK